ncbi:MAG TPA: hypothetical protein VIK18_10980, partial [Pirellulales bacterium]
MNATARIPSATRLARAVLGVVAAAGVLASGYVCLAEQVTVTLVGGSKITANLLRESSEGVVLDLGFDVLNVPAKRVLDIRRDKAGERLGAKQDSGVFTTGRLEA